MGIFQILINFHGSEKLTNYKTITSSPDGKETLLVTTDSEPVYYIRFNGKKEQLNYEAVVNWLLRHNHFDKILKFGLLPSFAHMSVTPDSDNEKQARREAFLLWFEKHHQEDFCYYIENYYGLCI